MSEDMTAQVEPSQVPVPPHGQDDAAPTPVERSTPKEEPKPVPEAKPDPKDLDAVLRRSMEKSQAQSKVAKEPVKEAEPKAAPKVEAAETPEARAERERNPDGKFKAKDAPEPSASTAEQVEGQAGEPKPRPSEGRDYSKPPAHFLPRAKEAWGSVNADVQGEVHRMVQNYEKGIAEHKEGSENWSRLKDFDQQAKALGTTIPDYIRNVRAIETLLQQNPVAGIERVLQQVGITPEQYARHILQQPQGQQPGQQQQRQPQTDPQVTQQLTQMQKIIQQQQQQFETMRLEAVANKFIEPFKAEHPRYDELEQDIAFFLNSGKIPTTLSERERLETAYDMAERINPAPTFVAREPGTQASPTRPLDSAGLKSVTGSPTPGLPTKRAPSKEDAKDLDATLRRAFARATAR